MKSLEGKVAVVTGAASGIGFALCRKLVNHGCSVGMIDVDGEALRRALAGVQGARGRAAAIVTDVTNLESVEAMAQQVTEQLGPPSVVFANAGVESGGAFGGISDDTWRWVLEVNLLGAIRTVRAFFPQLIQHDESHIVFTASQAFAAPWTPTFAPYGASKAALAAVAENLHQEMQREHPHVGVTVLVPGMTRTRMVESERTRPADVPSTREDGQRRALYDDLVRRTELEGMDPAEVAELAIEAIRERRFWALAQPKAIEAALESRLTWVREGIAPGVRRIGD